MPLTRSIQSLWNVRREMFRFAIASGASFLGIVGGTVLLHRIAGLSQQAAYAVVLVAVFVGNFLVLRHWVYRHLDSERSAGQQLVRTAAGSLVFRSLEYLGFLGLHTVLGVHYVLAIASVTTLAFVGKFSYYRNAVFGGRRAQPEADAPSPPMAATSAAPPPADRTSRYR